MILDKYKSNILQWMLMVLLHSSQSLIRSNQAQQ